MLDGGGRSLGAEGSLGDRRALLVCSLLLRGVGACCWLVLESQVTLLGVSG